MTTDPIDMPAGTVVGVPADLAPAAALEVPTAPRLADLEQPDGTILTVPVPGPPGPPGVPGEGPTWWFGEGEPDVIPGSKPGDRYLDETTGVVYVLGDQ